MPSFFGQAVTAGLLATTSLVTAMPYVPTVMDNEPQNLTAVTWADGHRQPDAILEGEEHHETFHGVHEHSDVPRKRPFHYKTQGIDWYNFAKVNSDKVLGKNIIDFPQGHRRTQVAAIAGVADKQGRAISDTVAIMTLQPHSDVCRFDLNSFDFFCLDATHRPVACTVGLTTSVDQGLGPVEPGKAEVFSFEPHTFWRTQMARAFVQPEVGVGLVMASMGLDLANLLETGALQNSTDNTDADDYGEPQKATLYVDNIHWTSHKCLTGTWAVITRHYGAYLRMFENPKAFQSGEYEPEADAIRDMVYVADPDKEDKERKADQKLEESERKQREEMQELHDKIEDHKHPVLKWILSQSARLGQLALEKAEHAGI